MLDGKVNGYFVLGENPAVGSANARLHAQRWRSSTGSSCATSSRSRPRRSGTTRPEIETGELRTEDIGTEVFFMPAAAHTEKDGSFTNTQRLLQWHHKAVEPPGDARSELWFMYHLGRRIREKLAGSDGPDATAPSSTSTWDYPTDGPHDEPSAEAVLREINGWDAEGRRAVGLHRAEGATARRACGCWIYSGCYADGRQPDRAAQARPRAELGRARVGLGVAGEPPHPLQPRLGRPRRQAVVGAQALRLVGRRARGSGPAPTSPTSWPTCAPDYVPPEDAKAEDALRGDEPFIMQADGRGWLFAPTGLDRRPAADALRAAGVAGSRTRSTRQRANPARQRICDRRRTAYHPSDGRPRRRGLSRTWSRPTG